MAGVSYVAADLATAGELQGAVAEGGLPPRADAVVHLATSRRHREFPAAAPDLFQVNVAAATVLLDYAWRVGAQQFILGSTGTVYEPYATDPLSEDQAVAPSSFFAATKVAVEHLMRCYAPFFATLSLRLFFPYGPGQTDRLIPSLVEAVRSRHPIRLPAQGEGIRFTPTFIDDIVDVFTAAILGQWGGIFNVAAPELFSLQQLVNKLSVLTGCAADFVRDPLISGPVIRPDLGKLAGCMPLNRFVNVETGFRRMIDAAECIVSA
jgi:UDP-glucose 4-epimerase